MNLIEIRANWYIGTTSSYNLYCSGYIQVHSTTTLPALNL